MLEAENWKIALKVYAGHPISALLLASQLMALTQSLQCGRKGIPETVAGLELPIESLYTHTDFERIGHKLFRLTVKGNLTPKHEKLISELGLKLYRT